jgi:thiopurine S-methyltransferase
MDREFWQERWQRNEIGFHQQEFNAHLQDNWGQLAVPAGGLVFVPLCGKSRDLLWLRARGHRVLGVEISSIAVRDFFVENALTPQVTRQGAFERHAADGLTVLCGDFFDLTPDLLQGVTGVYDRASLIALPLELRTRYVEHSATILPSGACTLLVTMEYPQGEMSGPPFSVGEDEVRRLYEVRYTVTHLHTKDILAENPRLRERGLSALREKVYRLAARTVGQP